MARKKSHDGELRASLAQVNKLLNSFEEEFGKSGYVNPKWSPLLGKKLEVVSALNRATSDSSDQHMITIPQLDALMARIGSCEKEAEAKTGKCGRCGRPLEGKPVVATHKIPFPDGKLPIRSVETN